MQLLIEQANYIFKGHKQKAKGARLLVIQFKIKHKKSTQENRPLTNIDFKHDFASVFARLFIQIPHPLHPKIFDET